MILRFDNVGHRFGPRRLFDDLHLEVRSGEWLAITGRNGSGKTTLIRILAGLLRPVRGDVHLLNGDRPLPPDERRLALGLVTPDLTLDAELTARENLSFHARMRGLPPGGEEALLEHVGLPGQADRRVGTFSSGMRQRMKYAFALQHAPSLLLLDEPTANLDVAGVEMVNGVREAQLERGILVVATNEAREADGATHTLHLDAVTPGA